MRWWVAALVFGAGITCGASAGAKPGTHPFSISTWDTRASSVVLGSDFGFTKDGHFNDFSYSANFASTKGKLLAQFGVHYMNLEEPGGLKYYGIGGNATALFQWPLLKRFDNGVPELALSWYLGGAPGILVAGKSNYLTIPMVTGLGLPYSPASWFTATPWFELSPGLNVDTRFNSVSLDDVSDELCEGEGTNITCESTLDEATAEKLVNKAVDLELEAAVGARAGLSLALHLSERWDLSARTAFTTLGPAFSGEAVTFFGAALTWRWDQIVPAVLPASRRLERESCEDVEARFRTCPNSKRWLTPEEKSSAVSRPAPAVNAAPGALMPVTPASPAPAGDAVAPGAPPPATAPAVPSAPAEAAPNAAPDANNAAPGGSNTTSPPTANPESSGVLPEAPATAPTPLR
jgi:hypothetical protein